MYLLENLNFPLILGICGLVVLLIIMGIVILLKKRAPKVRINQEFMDQLLIALGAIENVVDAKTLNGRVIIEVEDVEKVDLENLKVLSTKGIFITNQTIKMLFPYDSETISKEIKTLLHTK